MTKLSTKLQQVKLKQILKLSASGNERGEPQYNMVSEEVITNMYPSYSIQNLKNL